MLYRFQHPNKLYSRCYINLCQLLHYLVLKAGAVPHLFGKPDVPVEKAAAVSQRTSMIGPNEWQVDMQSRCVLRFFVSIHFTTDGGS